MGKYIVLFIINLPLLTVGFLGAISSYKTKRISRRRCMFQLLFWALLGVLLMLVEPLYDVLIRYNLTNSPPMSIFDAGLLTLVLFCLFLVKKANERIGYLNRKISRLHENLVIAEEQRHWDKER